MVKIDSPPPLVGNGKVAGLPIISITPYLLDPSSRDDVEERRAATSNALHRACRDYGFFYLDISAFVDPREPDDLTKLGRAFFSLPQEEKDKLALKNQDHARGYARLNENVTDGKADNHEGIDFYRPVENPDKSKPLWGTNQWPASVPGFRQKYEAWIEKMKSLGMILMEAMAIGLGMTPNEWKALQSQVDDSFWVMRVIGYPPLPNDHDGYSCGAHKDYGCLTFLYADPTPNALQVFVPKSKPGAAADLTGLPAEHGNEKGVWITADPIPGCVVCNIGEMWEIWSNGLYKSTLHRVVHRGNNYRVSIPFFFEPNFDAKIAPLPAALRIIKAEKDEAMDTKPTQLYKPVVYGDFLSSKVGSNFANGNGKYGNGTTNGTNGVVGKHSHGTNGTTTIANGKL
ncbi:Clavaminate synthase-like protein [Dendrothele bispora CBS 962.96]|uniref:Clavaminate synthase-like protein n=1 Tax=Dendrothele bispora (strain CBS 962.96) TaxID=1314807 RepID=A0A4S8LZ94_DENBC|nr:Clavaminate synthase-like protein [Dendrothele bispora CBS 962.96]